MGLERMQEEFENMGAVEYKSFIYLGEDAYEEESVQTWYPSIIC